MTRTFDELVDHFISQVRQMKIKELDKMALIGMITMIQTEHESKRQGKWIPVTERLPKENGFYLCLYKHKHPGGVAMDEGLSIVQMYKGKWNLNEIYAVTHWMPLPQPPKDGES